MLKSLFLKLTFLLILLGLFSVSIASKNKYTYFGPTKDFYVYDEINALLTATKYRIYLNSKELYEESLKADWIETDKRGAQVVFIALYEDDLTDTTVLFNEWGIGKNDMGLLVTLYYDKEEVPFLKSVSYEAGIKMMSLLTAYDFSLLYSQYLEPYKDEIGIMQLYFEVLNYIYVNIYHYDSFSYDLDSYVEQMYDYYKLPSSQKESFNLPLWAKIVIFIVFPSFGVGMFFTVKKIRGGGGRSVGYKFRR